MIILGDLSFLLTISFEVHLVLLSPCPDPAVVSSFLLYCILIFKLPSRLLTVDLFQVSDEWWFEPGHGDWFTCLEKYTLCRDGMYHKVCFSKQLRI